jgi:mannitol/fructose-specific phosphotransferase system IIA component (Ntr-type)
MQETAENAGRRVDLSSVLTPRVMEPRLAADTKEGVIDELLTILWRTGNLTDIGPAREAVLAREQSMSTGMQYGIALPHARTDAVGGIVLAVGLKPQGMDFDSLDGNPSTIFVLMLSCASAATPHVEYLSAVSQVLDETGRRDLLACDTPEAMCEVLRRRAAEKFPAAAGGAGMLRRMSARTAT